MVRKPPDLPRPRRAIRCLITPPPRSASMSPASAWTIASQRSSSRMPSWLAKRPKPFVEKMRPALLLPISITRYYSTKSGSFPVI